MGPGVIRAVCSAVRAAADPVAELGPMCLMASDLCARIWSFTTYSLQSPGL